jgi:hypothetical protein
MFKKNPVVQKIPDFIIKDLAIMDSTKSKVGYGS